MGSNPGKFLIFPWKIPVWIFPESAHGSPELVEHASLIEVDGMSSNTPLGRLVGAAPWPPSA